VGMTTSTADMEGKMTMVEGMMGTTIMERLAVMVVMVDMADTATTKVLFE